MLSQAVRGNSILPRATSMHPCHKAKRTNRGAPLILLVFLAIHTVHAEEISGNAHAIDGDTIQVAHKRIRLHGIDAPEIPQNCERRNGRKYACGSDAMFALRRYIGGRKVTCKTNGTDTYGRTLGTCSVGTSEINEWMVSNGHAVAYKRYSRRYAGAEQTARVRRAGIWQGRFVRPDQWRHGKRLR